MKPTTLERLARLGRGTLCTAVNAACGLGYCARSSDLRETFESHETHNAAGIELVCWRELNNESMKGTNG